MDVRNLPITDIKTSQQSLRFVITETTPAFVNSLRRIILSYVPTIAVEEVIFVENNTAMFDEYIAHRLGLIPLNSDIDYLNVQEDCDVCHGVGCNSCTITLTLTQETDLTTKEYVIQSRDLIPSDPSVYPMVDEVPIMKMGSDQRLILEAIARIGTGREHAKWQPVASLGFQYMPVIDIKPDKKFNKEVVTACPRDVLELDSKTHNINIKNLLRCNLCMECVETDRAIREGDNEEEAIKVVGDPTQIIFSLETTGALTVERIVAKAADIMSEKAEDFIESFQEALEEVKNDPAKMKKISSFERIPLKNKEYEV